MSESKPQRRVFGYIEAVIDAAYLLTALTLGVFMLVTGESAPRTLAGWMATVLAGGDMFHLAPRLAAVITHDEMRFQRAMGIGKLITSITMTAFYVMLWHVGLLLGQDDRSGWTVVLYALALSRAAFCFLPQNRWLDKRPPVKWSILRNVPFVIMGIIIARFFAVNGLLSFVPLAIVLSFIFYIPVVLFSHAHPIVGMLMLPKTMMYVWILVLCVQGIA